MTFDDLIAAYATGFYGYGSGGAQFWFIGLEDGGGSSLAEVQRQVGCWDAHGRPEVDDLGEVHTCMGLTRWSATQPPLQTTWAQLIRVVLTAQGKPTDVESIRRYQVTKLGRKDGDTRLIDLLPLPSQSISQWRYAEWTTLPQFQNREAYVDHVARLRTERIKQAIAAQRPVS